jgi:uncharacterized protein YnzC (UPF0291/DUF896 family)
MKSPENFILNRDVSADQETILNKSLDNAPKINQLETLTKNNMTTIEDMEFLRRDYIDQLDALIAEVETIKKIVSNAKSITDELNNPAEHIDSTGPGKADLKNRLLEIKIEGTHIQERLKILEEKTDEIIHKICEIPNLN